MERGWSAAGLIRPLYGKHGGREGLAKKVGASPATLSAIQNGRQNLGEGLARKLVAKTDATMATLGAPLDLLNGRRDMTVASRLQELAAEKANAEDVKAALRVFAAAIDSLTKGDTRAARRLLSEAGYL